MQLIRVWPCFPILLVALAGCDVRVNTAKPLTWTTENYPGRYVFEVEGPQPSNKSSTFHFSDSGDKKEKEIIDLTIGETKIHVDMEELTVNGAAKGKLKNGDKIQVFANGDVMVNGEKR